MKSLVKRLFYWVRSTRSIASDFANFRATWRRIEVIFDSSLQQFLCECSQDGAVVLKLNDCVLIRNMNLHLEEPFDHLLACVHQLLTLQPQKVPGEDSSIAGDSFGFTFSEEQDVRLSADEIFDVISYCAQKTILAVFFSDPKYWLMHNMIYKLCFALITEKPVVQWRVTWCRFLQDSESCTK